MSACCRHVSQNLGLLVSNNPGLSTYLFPTDEEVFRFISFTPDFVDDGLLSYLKKNKDLRVEDICGDGEGA